MKKLAVLIAFLQIAFAHTSFAQSTTDSLICFTATEARQIARVAAEHNALIVEVDNYTRWNRDLQLQVDILKTEQNQLTEQNNKLTTKLNQAVESQKKARKSRLWWGVGGALGGILIYNLLTK